MSLTRSMSLFVATVLAASPSVSAQAGPDTVRAGGNTFIIGPARSCKVRHAYLNFRFFTPGLPADVSETELRQVAEYALFVEGYAPRPRPRSWSSDDPTPVVTVEVDLWPERGVSLRSSLDHPGRPQGGGGIKGMYGNAADLGAKVFYYTNQAIARLGRASCIPESESPAG